MAVVGMEMSLSGVGLVNDGLEDEACFQRGYGGCGFEPLGCVSRREAGGCPQLQLRHGLQHRDSLGRPGDIPLQLLVE